MRTKIEKSTNNASAYPKTGWVEKEEELIRKEVVHIPSVCCPEKGSTHYVRYTFFKTVIIKAAEVKYMTNFIYSSSTFTKHFSNNILAS